MKLLIAMLVLPVIISGQTPYAFHYQRVADMPMRTANNAVVGATVNGYSFAYSFCGIDSTLANTGIHLRSFKYDVANDQWALLPDVPDTLGKIAASASEVNGVIYLIGGYHVFNGSPFELSSNKVHRFDTQTDSWLTDGADIPIAIDDQVQAVWRDSLIFVVTGWSNTTNVPNVQIYDPANDVWRTGTNVPNNNFYKTFGANGYIIGDTLYYYGGASTAFNFPATNMLRKGYIDPADPTQVSWSFDNNTPGSLYRPGAFGFAGGVHWIGGSATSYNYNAIAYNGSGVVSPTMQIRSYTPDGSWNVNDYSNELDSLPVMDIRGVADINGTSTLPGADVLIAGGIGFGQNVLGSTYLIQGLVTGIDDAVVENEKISVFPNPATDKVFIRSLDGIKYTDYQVYDGFGRLHQKGAFQGAEMALDIKDLPSGQYFLKLLSDHHVTECRFWSVK